MHRLTAGFLLAAALALPAAAFGQTATGSTASSQPPAPLPVITGPSDIPVGRTIVLDASFSTVPSERVTYQWFVDGSAQPISRAVEALYTPERPGVLTFRLVIESVTPDGTVQTVEATHPVVAYARKMILIADTAVEREKLELHRQTAEGAGVFLQILQPPESAIPFGQEEAFASFLEENKRLLLGASAIVLWSDSPAPLQAMSQAMSDDPEILQSIRTESIVLITGSSFQTVARTVQAPFAVLQPQQIIITRKEALNPLLLAQHTASFLREIEQRDIDHLVIDASSFSLRPWNVLSFMVNSMLSRGVQSQTIILLLMLPFIATILAFFKQVVGITTFGLYTPSIVALSFLALGWQVGILFLLFIIITGYATRTAMRRFRLLYIPKVAIIITVVSVTLLLMLTLASYAGASFSRDTVFVLLIMSTLSESFLNLKKEEGMLSAIIAIGETILAALLCALLAQWSKFQGVVLAYPELVLVTILVNLLLGRWTGLRLLEYFRFREVFRHLQEE